MDLWTLFTIPRSFIMVSIVSDDASYMPRALIERFMKVIVRYCERRSCIRRLYFITLRLLFTSIFVSNPTVNSKMQRVLSGELKAKSGRRESPVISEGDGKDGISTNNRQRCKEVNEFAILSRTEL